MKKKKEKKNIIGDNIKRFRGFLLMNQTVLAEKAGISETYVCHMERGDKTPSIRVLKKIAEALDIDISNFFKEQSSLKDLLE